MVQHKFLTRSMRKANSPIRSLFALSLITTSSFLPSAPAFSQPNFQDPNNIPITGSGAPQLDPILQSLTEFMHHRCVGAAVLGVAVKGKPVGIWGLGRMNGRPTDNWNPACGDDLKAPLAYQVQPNTPMRVGSISKTATFAMVRWALKKVAKDEGGLELTDEQIEGLKLFDPQHYPPLIPGTNKSYPVAIIPKNLYEVFSGKVKYPVAIKDSFKYGGDKEKETLCADLKSGYADKQWQSVTLGNFLSHRAGLQRSAPSFEDEIVPNIPVIRNLKTKADFENQEKIVRQEWGNQNVNSAKNQLSLNQSYFISDPTLSEYMLVMAGRCLRYSPGTKYSYSNTSPAFPTIILERLMGSKRYGAEVGKPETHKGSALDIFFQTQLNVQTTATEGVFITSLVPNLPGDREPKKRDWNGKSYYGTTWDTKRPHCVWTGKVCDFTSWQNKKTGLINWSWNLKQVPFPYAGSGISPGTGSLAVEPKAFLKFMSQYWLAGYTSNPFVGEERNNTWNRYATHNGAYDGAYAEAIQLGGSNNPKEWSLPPRDAKGSILDAFDQEKLQTYKASLPDGVDIFVAVNQLADKKCVVADQVNTKEKGYNCGSAYGLLNNFVLYGASRVNWQQLQAINNDKLGF
ncbi:Beta-lactamase [Cylindrospermum stagnale PCC 7417]|uniref:Beta-lactamase n=1 Tax=Cylindrospermum stagnale PCC 7417 TaxID=56107 RepID=K9WV31_9NOST|nr:serine hydrolase [Cylindrospermum stagnale]AFZ24245.1 Beta-lactamase [Cylindrospermum stagnale PCC 7417]